MVEVLISGGRAGGSGEWMTLLCPRVNNRPTWCRIIDSRDVLLRDEKPGRGPLLQSLSTGESGSTLDGGPMSPRPLVPNLRPGPSSSLGLNLPPMVQVSSLSAAPPLSEPTKPEVLRLTVVSDSGGGARVGRLERQSPEVSETGVAVDCRSLGGPS